MNEIAHLSGATALANMKQFCKESFNNRLSSDPTKNFYCFYFFSEAVYKSPDMKRYSGYGYAFADLIRSEKLGDLIETEEVVNVAFHPDHSNKMWVWTPNPAEVYKWYVKNCPEDHTSKVSTIMDDALKGIDLGDILKGIPDIPLENVVMEAAVAFPKPKRKRAPRVKKANPFGIVKVGEPPLEKLALVQDMMDIAIEENQRFLDMEYFGNYEDTPF